MVHHQDCRFNVHDVVLVRLEEQPVVEQGQLGIAGSNLAKIQKIKSYDMPIRRGSEYRTPDYWISLNTGLTSLAFKWRPKSGHIDPVFETLFENWTINWTNKQFNRVWDLNVWTLMSGTSI